MIRKLNFTGRKKIGRARVRIFLREGPGRRWFDAALELDGLALPGEAQVYVEAYHRISFFRRFPWGTAASPCAPADRSLAGCPVDSPLFRVKVVDRRSGPGRILAAQDKLRAVPADESEAGQEVLLHVEYRALGQRVWRLDLTGDWPTLELNAAAATLPELARSDPAFHALVYPEVVRAVLHEVLVERDHTDPYCDDDWPSLWLQLACSLPGVGQPPAGTSEAQRGAKTNWIDAAVEAFCARRHLLAGWLRERG